MVYYRCGDCGKVEPHPVSCGHRACNACGQHKSKEWEARQKSRLLPVPYHMVTFTVPSEFRDFFRKHQKLCYSLLFRESAGALADLAADPRNLGGELGMTGILQTWTRDLRYVDSVAAPRLLHPCGAAPSSLSVSAPTRGFGSPHPLPGSRRSPDPNRLGAPPGCQFPRLPQTTGRADAQPVPQRPESRRNDSVAAPRLLHPCGAAPSSLSVSAPPRGFGSNST
jgi:hypothetical protein